MTRLILSVFVTALCSAAAVAAAPPWYEAKDTWFETHIACMKNIYEREQKQGRKPPEYSNTEKLPLVLYPTSGGRFSAKFKIDVSGRDKVYIGARFGLYLHRGEFISADGKKTPIADRRKRRLNVRAKRLQKRGRYKLNDRFEVRDGEVELMLGGNYKWFTGVISSKDSGFYWIDTAPRYNTWSRFPNDRRRVYDYVKRMVDAKYTDESERKRVYDEIQRHSWALPNGYKPATSMKDAARVYAEAMASRYRAKDTRPIIAAISGVAESVRTGGDFLRLMRLGDAALKHPELKEIRGKAQSLKDCPAILTAVSRLEKEFLQLDPKKFDYGPALDARFKQLKMTISEVGQLDSFLKLTRDTVKMVEKSGRVPSSIPGRIDSLEKKLADCRDDFDSFAAAFNDIKKLRREILFSHPAVKEIDKLLINVNPPTKYSHNGDQHLGRHSRTGHGLTVLSDWKTDNPKVNYILKDKLPPGAVRNPDLNYDADKVVFAFCDHRQTEANRRRYFLWEAAIDGSWVRQLTGTKRDKFETWDGRASVVIEDNDPVYLPNGDLIFISTRSQSFGRCHGSRYNPAWVLHRCDKDGANIRQISFNNENEYEPAVLNDGRIVFTRWEYTNRHEMLFHMLWACRPDGSNVTHYYGNDTLHPMEIVETTPIPGTHKVVATAQGHHSYNTGTSVIIDTNIGENGEEPVTHITPETPYSETKGWPSPHFSHPYPITEDIFLVSRAGHRIHKQGMTPPPNGRAIYLIDSLGGRELIYEDPNIASVSPIPIRKRERPPMLPSTLPENAPEWGTVFLQNAYLTRNDPEGIIKPGMIKAIRVNALGIQSSNRRHGVSKDCKNEIPKKVLGTVPVDEDGSAFFKVPARMSLQVQTLDKDGMAILTEKSFFYVMPGENRSCIGCHEPVGTSPVRSALAKTAQMTPKDLNPPAGPQYVGGLSFMRTVQPVLDRYCIKCHGLADNSTEKGKKSNKINLVHDGRTNWPSSYSKLLEYGEHRVGLKQFMGDNGPNKYNVSRPRRFYAWSSKLPKMIRANHNKVDMDHDSYMRIIEWLDVNAQCYGDMFRNKLEYRKIDPNAMKLLRAYIQEKFGDKLAKQPDRALINVAQIDESRILMAPLAKSGGGWGLLNGWRSKSDPSYKKMAELVDKAIIRDPNENTKGWVPDLKMGGGEDWVMEEREKFLRELRAK